MFDTLYISGLILSFLALMSMIGGLWLEKVSMISLSMAKLCVAIIILYGIHIAIPLQILMVIGIAYVIYKKYGEHIESTLMAS